MEDNLKTELRKTGYEGINWIPLPHDRVNCEHSNEYS
jgi:hypothetical protein